LAAWCKGESYHPTSLVNTLFEDFIFIPIKIIMPLVFLLIILTFSIASVHAQSSSQDVLKRSNDLIRTGKFSEAIDMLSRTLQSNKKDPMLYATRGSAYFDTRAYVSAIADFSSVLQLKPSPVLASYAYCSRGACYTNIQQFDSAVSDLSAAIRASSTNLTAHLNRGILYALLGKNEAAITDLSNAIKLDSRNPSLFYERGNVYAKLKRFDKAVKDLSDAIRLNPKFVEAYANRAACYGNAGNSKAAEQDLTKVIELTPRSTMAYLNRGTARVLMQEYKSAIEDFTQALNIDSTNTQAFLNRASAKRLMKDFAGAIADATLLLKRNPQDQVAFLNSTSFVNSKMNNEKFNNGLAYASRAYSRADLADTLGARLDIQKAVDLGLDASLDTLSKFQIHSLALVPDADFPSSLQLYPRDAQDSAIMRVSGSINLAGFDSVVVELHRDGAPWKRLAARLLYEQDKAAFLLKPTLHAALSLYSLRLRAKSATRDTTLALRDSIVCGDVMLAAGQSNIVLGETWPVQNGVFVRTFKYGHADNSWVIANAANEDGMGGVGALSLRMAEQLIAQHKIPICIINGGIAASTIEQHQRFTDEPTNPFTLYGRMLRRAQRAGIAASARGLVWYQGESDKAENYSERFAALYRAWKSDYPALSKVYAVQIRPSTCAQDDQATVRDIQRRFSTMFSSVVVMPSVGIKSHDGCHYTTDGYRELGDNIARLVARDFYRSSDTAGIAPPMLRKASFSNARRTEIILEFSPYSELQSSGDTIVAGALRKLPGAFFANGDPSDQYAVQGVRIENNTVILQTPNGINIGDISYVPNTYDGKELTKDAKLYSGPWLVTKRGVPAAAFYRVPVQMR
jgi:tetratricopeptide (TPR) repeat protein